MYTAAIFWERKELICRGTHAKFWWLNPGSFFLLMERQSRKKIRKWTHNFLTNSQCKRINKSWLDRVIAHVVQKTTPSFCSDALYMSMGWFVQDIPCERSGGLWTRVFIRSLIHDDLKVCQIDWMAHILSYSTYSWVILAVLAALTQTFSCLQEKQLAPLALGRQWIASRVTSQHQCGFDMHP